LLHRVPSRPSAQALPTPQRACSAATHSGEFLGNYTLRNAHGEREPWQTSAWLAATSHLFDLALQQASHKPDANALSRLQALTALVTEVDDRTDELVAFEDTDAELKLSHELNQARRLLRPAYGS